MLAEHKPSLGSVQPETGSKYEIVYCCMGRRSKSQKPPTIIRATVAANVVTLRNRKYAAHGNETAMNRALARDAQTVLSQIQRIIGQKTGASIDQIETLAKALDCRPQDLLTPYFSNTVAPSSPSRTNEDDGDPLQRKSG